MASASIDHMLSLTIFIAALLIFIGMFSSTIQNGVTYQQHTAISTKTSDLLDTLLLNPGLPADWGQTDTVPVGFGLQDANLSQYKLCSLSAMRLTCGGPLVSYPTTGGYFNNLSAGYGGYLLTPTDKTVDYLTASQQLGVNGTYGFQLTLTPTIAVSIQKTQNSPLNFSIAASGTGFVLANANVTYSLIVVNQDANPYPSYTIYSGKTSTNEAGIVQPQISFTGIDGESRSYALIVYTYLYGLKGAGYYVHVPNSGSAAVVPLVDSFQNRNITLAHSDTVGAQASSPASELSYNASFAIVTEEYSLRQVILDQPTGKVGGSEPSYSSVQVPDNSGILIVAYKNTASGECGIVLMPWGLGSLAFPVTFGGNATGYDWVTTDIRQVTIDGIAYQAKLSLWSLQGGG